MNLHKLIKIPRANTEANRKRPLNRLVENLVGKGDKRAMMALDRAMMALDRSPKST